MLPSGGVPRRTRTAVAPALLSSRAPSSAYAEEISTNELALRLGLDLRALTPAAGSLAKKEREFSRGVGSVLAPAPTDSTFWTPASGLRILREGLTTGAQPRELASGRGWRRADGSRRACAWAVMIQSLPRTRRGGRPPVHDRTDATCALAQRRGLAGRQRDVRECVLRHADARTGPARDDARCTWREGVRPGAARSDINQNTRSNAHTAELRGVTPRASGVWQELSSGGR
jgi:hypothetical protein